jgi:hypothetical protein
MVLDRLNRHDLSDDEWERLPALLRAESPQVGRWSDHRAVINGIIFRARAGCPWGGTNREALGRSRGGLTTKIYLVAGRRCRPLIRISAAALRTR